MSQESKAPRARAGSGEGMRSPGGAPTRLRGAAPRRPGRRREHAVSEVVATALLLGISVGVFAVLGLEVARLPAPAETTHADLGVSLNRTGALLVSHLGGDPVPLAGLVVRLDLRDCAVRAGPATDLDGAREDGDGRLVTGERVAAACDASRGGMLTVVGGQGARRGVLLHLTLPAPPGGGA